MAEIVRFRQATERFSEKRMHAAFSPAEFICRKLEHYHGQGNRVKRLIRI